MLHTPQNLPASIPSSLETSFCESQCRRFQVSVSRDTCQPIVKTGRQISCLKLCKLFHDFVTVLPIFCMSISSIVTPTLLIFVVFKSNLSIIHLWIAKSGNVNLQNIATKCQNSEMLYFWIGLKPIVLTTLNTATIWLSETTSI